MKKSGMTPSEVIDNNLTRVIISNSPKANKKLQAKISFNTGRFKTIHFGAKGMEDYTTYYKKDKELAKQKRENYIKRHQSREDFSEKGVFTAGFLSRWILWEYPTIKKSVDELNNRFKKIIFIIKNG